MFSKSFNLIIALSLMFLLSCDDDFSTLEKNTHRIQQSLMNYDYDTYKVVYSYKGEKLDSVIQYQQYYDNDWVEVYKTIITYDRDKIILNSFRNYGGWIQTDEIEYKFDNGFLKEMKDFVSEYYYSYYRKITFSYSGKNCILAEYSRLSGTDTWIPYRKNEFIYQNNELIEYKSFELEYENWYQNYKELYLLENGRISEYVSYSTYEEDNWEKDYKNEYKYAGNNIIGISGFYWDNYDSEWISGDISSFEYDEYNNLTKTICDWSTLTFVYEPGHGNISLFLDPVSNRQKQPSIKNSRNKNIFISQIREKYFGE